MSAARNLETFSGFDRMPESQSQPRSPHPESTMPLTPDTAESSIPDQDGLKGLIQQLAQQMRQQGSRQEAALKDLQGSVQRLGDRLNGVVEQASRHEERWVNHKEWQEMIQQHELPSLRERMAALDAAIVKAVTDAQHARDKKDLETEPRFSQLHGELNTLKAETAAGVAAAKIVTDWRSQGKIVGAILGLGGTIVAAVLVWWITASLASLDARISGKAPSHVEPPTIEYHPGGEK